MLKGIGRLGLEFVECESFFGSFTRRANKFAIDLREDVFWKDCFPTWLLDTAKNDVMNSCKKPRGWVLKQRLCSKRFFNRLGSTFARAFGSPYHNCCSSFSLSFLCMAVASQDALSNSDIALTGFWRLRFCINQKEALTVSELHLIH